MKLHLKNMVCDRCIYVVDQVLQGMGKQAVQITLGEVDLGEDELSKDELKEFTGRIEKLGFEMINNRKARQIERLKKAVLKYTAGRSEFNKTKLSDYLAQSLGMDYSYLSHLFSESQGSTIEQFYIQARVERAKELIVYDEKSLTEIAAELGFSGPAHLSRQFKKITGLTPSHFRRLGDGKKRKSLDKI